VAKPQLRPAYRVVPAILRELRENAGLTQRELGKRLGLPQNTIHRMEVASRRCDPVELIDWAKACGADPVTTFRRIVSKRNG